MEVADYREKADEIDLLMQEMLCKIEEVERIYSRLEEECRQHKQDMRQIIRFSHLNELTQEVMDVFVKKVTVYQDKRVEIEWNYVVEDL